VQKISKHVTLCLFLSLSFGCQADSFYVEKATLSEIDAHLLLRNRILQKNERIAWSNEYLSITGHRISADGGIVFGHRLFSKGVIPLVDQASFEKLSIQIPSGETHHKMSTISIKSDKDVLVFWSKGPSNFPRGSGCYGYASDGYII
jgi:hypothetical protein